MRVGGIVDVVAGIEEVMACDRTDFAECADLAGLIGLDKCRNAAGPYLVLTDRGIPLEMPRRLLLRQ
jgi:hypothetical protein